MKCNKTMDILQKMCEISIKIHNITNDYFRDFDVNNLEMHILSCLAEKNDVIPKEICKFVAGKPANVSRRLDSLIRKGYVERVDKVDEKDRRKNFFMITSEGKALLADLDNKFRNDEAFAELGKFFEGEDTEIMFAKINKFNNILQKIHENK